jgi:hypothetical protein
MRHGPLESGVKLGTRADCVKQAGVAREINTLRELVRRSHGPPQRLQYALFPSPHHGQYNGYGSLLDLSIILTLSEPFRE